MHLRGTTLIEAVIYIALLSILMGGTVGAVYQILLSSSSVQAHDTVQEEGNFAIRKVEWALTGASAITVVSPTEFSVSKYDGTTADNKLSGGGLVMQEGSGSFLPLTTPNVSVSSVQFVSIPASGSGPAGMSVTLSISGQTFTTTRYLRK